jgi:type VI secretion system secreted protein Hcp
MANMFLMLADIDGESLDDDHHDRIEFLDMAWNNAHAVSRTRKDEESSTKPTIGDITITKICDKASANLLKYCCLGTNIPIGRITFRKNAGDDKVEYMVIDMWNVKISHFEWNFQPEGGYMQEVVHLNMAQFYEQYTVQKDDGTEGDAVHFGFDIPENEEFG